MDELNGRRGAPGHLSDEVLTAYLDNATDLTPVARATVEAHLAGCPACRRALRDLDLTVGLLRGLPQLAPRHGFALTPELVEAGRGRQRRRDPAPAPARRFAWVWPVRWASALATLLFAIVVGLDASGPAPASQPPTATQVVAVATSTPTPGLLVSAPGDLPEVIIFGTPEFIYPTATPVVALPPPAAVSEADYRVAEVGLGALALVLGAAGFLAPPFLRRRTVAA
jgi:hypothetical protein